MKLNWIGLDVCDSQRQLIESIIHTVRPARAVHTVRLVHTLHVHSVQTCAS